MEKEKREIERKRGCSISWGCVGMRATKAWGRRACSGSLRKASESGISNADQMIKSEISSSQWTRRLDSGCITSVKAARASSSISAVERLSRPKSFTMKFGSCASCSTERRFPPPPPPGSSPPPSTVLHVLSAAEPRRVGAASWPMESSTNVAFRGLTSPQLPPALLVVRPLSRLSPRPALVRPQLSSYDPPLPREASAASEPRSGVAPSIIESSDRVLSADRRSGSRPPPPPHSTPPMRPLPPPPPPLLSRLSCRNGGGSGGPTTSVVTGSADVDPIGASAALRRAA